MDGSSDVAAERPKVALVALGCRVSRADLDALAGELAEGPLDLARDGERADVVVVNGCAITCDAESATRQAIRRVAREHPGARIVVAGCYAETARETAVGLPEVSAVVGARSQSGLASLLASLCGRPAEAAPRQGRRPAPPARHARPLLKVQDGCDQRCSYCIVPLARGGSRSLPIEDAVARLRALGERHPEVVVTGIHLGAYGRDLAPRSSLAELLRETARAGGVRRVRLSSVEPRELPVDVLQDAAVRSLLCEHFHLPIQSGSPRTLAAMRRPYGPEDVRRVVEEVAALVPGACVGTDVLAGFPGESDDDHRETFRLVESLPFAYLQVFPFSPRPGTPAASMPGRVPVETVRTRVRELRALSDSKWRAFLDAQVARALEVVVERVEGGLARGTSRQYATVRWPASGEPRGALVRVRVDGHDGAECFGVCAS